MTVSCLVTSISRKCTSSSPARFSCRTAPRPRSALRAPSSTVLPAPARLRTISRPMPLFPSGHQCDLLRGSHLTETPPAIRDSLKRHSARHFNPLTVDPAIFVRKKRRDHGADIVRHAGAPERGHIRYHLVDFGVVAHHAAAKVGLNR